MQNKKRRIGNVKVIYNALCRAWALLLPKVEHKRKIILAAGVEPPPYVIISMFFNAQDNLNLWVNPKYNQQRFYKNSNLLLN